MNAKILWIVCLFLFLPACGSAPSDAEQEVRAWLQQGQQAAEEKDRKALVEMISPEYADRDGRDRRAIDGMLRYYFLRQDKVAFVTHIEELTVFDGTAAEVLMTVGMAGNNDNALGFSADAKRFLLELELDDDEWLLVAARWGELGEDL